MDKCSLEQDYTKTGVIIAVTEVRPGSLRKPCKCTGNLESERPGSLWGVMSLAKYPWDAKESSNQPTKLEHAAQESGGVTVHSGFQEEFRCGSEECGLMVGIGLDDRCGLFQP